MAGPSLTEVTKTLPSADLPSEPREHGVPGRSQARAGRRRPLSGLTGVLVDVVLINVAFAIAWYVRYQLELGREVAEADYLPWSVYLPIQWSLTAILLVVFGSRGLYSTRGRDSLTDVIGEAIWGTLVGVALMIVVVFLFRPFGYSRLIFAYAIVAICTLLALARIAAYTYRSMQWRKGIGLQRVLVVGAGPQGRLIVQNVVAQPGLGMRLVGFVDDEYDNDLGRISHLGTADAIPHLVAQYQIDEVIVALPSTSHAKVAEILATCANRRLNVRIVPDFYELRLNQVDITNINGIPLIGLRDVSLRTTDLLMKRLVDVVGATVALVLASPLMALVALAIKLDSPGTVFVRLPRTGRGGKPFTCYKFRSMRVGADRELEALRALNEADGPLFKMRNDPRCTRIGRYLRKFSIDELPQLYNVLRGEMSLVGPRPPTPDEVVKYDDWHRQRLEVTPGITGLWQVSGRSDLSFAEMVLLDIWYIENWSLALDFKILLRTAPAVLFGIGAY